MTTTNPQHHERRKGEIIERVRVVEGFQVLVTIEIFPDGRSSKEAIFDTQNPPPLDAQERIRTEAIRQAWNELETPS